MLNHKSTIPFGIIGLGRFGTALAESLATSGHEVLVLDGNENKVQLIQDVVDQALVVPHLDKKALLEAGIQNCETVIVAIGEAIEVSILVTLNVIELGVPRVISKAISADHGKVLQRMGAEVVYPEKDMATRLANTLTSHRAIDYIELSDEYEISELKVEEACDGHNLHEMNIRKKFGLNVIAIIKNDKPIIDFDPDMILEEGNIIVVVGKKVNIARFAKHLH